MTESIECHRCGAVFDPERFDLDGWLALDAREDGWTLLVCRPERDAVRALDQKP